MRKSEKRKLIEAAIQSIADRNNGRVTPQQVLDLAKDKDSPLHDQFDWNDKSAANSYRLGQARNLIKSVRIKWRTSTSTIKTVGYVRDPDDDKADTGYLSISRVKSNEDEARDVLTDCFSRIRNAIERGRNLASVLDMEHDMDAMLEQVNCLADKLHAQPTGRMDS